MATKSWPAQGTIVAVDETGTGTYSTVGLCTSFSHAGGGSVGERDTTVLTSTVRTSAPTIPDNGEFSFSMLYDPTDAVHVALRGMKDTPVVGGMKVTFNDTGNTTVTAAAWVKEFDGVNGDDVDASLTVDVTMRVTGAVT